MSDPEELEFEAEHERQVELYEEFMAEYYMCRDEPRPYPRGSVK